MNTFEKKIYNVSDQKQILQRSTFWNFISSIFNASLTAIIIFFLSWSNNDNLTGIFSIATAIAYQVQAVGFFGVRNYHITDVKHNYSFSDYVYVNMLSSVMLIVVLVLFTFGRGYSLEKSLIILFYSLYRAVDIYEALFHDEYQRYGRIDIGLILQTIRFFITLVIIVLCLILTKDMVLAFFLAFVTSVIVVIIQNKEFSRRFHCKLERLNKKRIKKLLIICLPICISGFISMYLTNSPKYAIDNVLDDKAQGLFAILFIPVFTINLLSTVIYRPYITKISEYWHANNIRYFIKNTLMQILVIFVLTILITGFGYLIGLKLLGLLYNTDLNNFKTEFTILLLGGGLNTLSVFLSQILIIMEEQNFNFIIYAISFLATLLLGNTLTQSLNILGASLLYFIASLILVILSVFLIIYKVRKKKIVELS